MNFPELMRAKHHTATITRAKLQLLLLGEPTMQTASLFVESLQRNVHGKVSVMRFSRKAQRRFTGRESDARQSIPVLSRLTISIDSTLFTTTAISTTTLRDGRQFIKGFWGKVVPFGGATGRMRGS